jgi:hypothetical protein
MAERNGMAQCLGTQRGCRRFLEAMSKTAEVNDPSYWQQRAQDTRRLASQMQDAVTKEVLLEIAKTYERIGAIAQSRRIATPQ